MRALFIGGDLRMSCAAEKLSETHLVERLGLGEAPLPEGKFDMIVLPLPLTKNGKDIFAPLSENTLSFSVIKQYAAENSVIFAGGECPRLNEICAEGPYKQVNYFAEESLTLKNAALTAEAACALLSQSTDGALLGSKTLIAGYGRIARFLAARLRANGSAVTIAARRGEQRALAELDGFSAVPITRVLGVINDFDFIANTVPFGVFDEEHFLKMRVRSVFMELASLPEQPARAFAERFAVKYIHAGGLPGRYSPKAAGEAVAQVVAELSAKP